MSGSVARGFGINGKSFYSNICKPTEVNLQFTVTPTNGLGITSLKSNGYVRNAFMHTSTTPAANDGYTNPNPANGYLFLQLKNNFNAFIGSRYAIVPPNSGSDVKIDNSAMTAGLVYVITTLGNATLAKWQAIGVPPGVTPAVGVSFVALTNGGAGNTLTSRVQVPLVSGVAGLEPIGLPDTMDSYPLAQYAGQWLTMQFLGVSGSSAAATFTGSALGTHTHVFTGDALAAHNHNLIVKGGQAPSTTNNLANYAGPLLGKEEATDATYIGANSATSGGVVSGSAGTPAGTNAATSAGTPAGTISAAAFTGAMALVAPATGSIVSLKLYFDGSSVTVDGL